MAAAPQDEASRVKLEAWLVTDVGVVREHNEDSAYMEPANGFFIVADGMGGHAAGEVASAMAVETVRKTLEAARKEIESFQRAPTDTGRRGIAAGRSGQELLSGHGPIGALEELPLLDRGQHVLRDEKIGRGLRSDRFDSLQRRFGLRDVWIDREQVADHRRQERPISQTKTVARERAKRSEQLSSSGSDDLSFPVVHRKPPLIETIFAVDSDSWRPTESVHRLIDSSVQQRTKTHSG